MQIINFTEPLIKPALQDRSKCWTIRPAWTVISSEDGICREFTWFEQSECRHKVGALEQIMWMQRGKNGVCGNCINESLAPESICGVCDGNQFCKIFGVGKILRTPKIWMDGRHNELVISDLYKNPLEIITDKGTFFKSTSPSISMEDGFKNPLDFKNFFLRKYPILLEERMPFWRVGWEWQRNNESS